MSEQRTENREPKAPGKVLNCFLLSVFCSRRASRGFALVEALVASAILAAVIAAAAGAYLLLLQHSSGNAARIQAEYLAEEGLEAVRLLRDSSWTSNIASQPIGTAFYLAWSGTSWQPTAANTYIDGTFERNITLASVNRDASSYDIVASGGSNDANTRLVTVTVSWRDGSATSSRSLSTYLVNMFNN